MTRWGFNGDIDEWRLRVADAIGSGAAEDILDAVGRDWSDTPPSELPRGPEGVGPP